MFLMEVVSFCFCWKKFWLNFWYVKECKTLKLKKLQSTPILHTPLEWYVKLRVNLNDLSNTWDQF